MSLSHARLFQYNFWLIWFKEPYIHLWAGSGHTRGTAQIDDVSTWLLHHFGPLGRMYFLNTSTTKTPYTIMLCPSLSALVSSPVHTPPSHRVRHKNFICGMNMPYAHQMFSDSDLQFLNGSHFDTFL